VERRVLRLGWRQQRHAQLLRCSTIVDGRAGGSLVSV
jgi:hypothetical protein